MFIRNERGNVVILVVLFMAVIIAFTALTVDAGYLYLRKAQLQDRVDAMALAGGQDLPNKEAAFNTVYDYAAKNGLEIGSFKRNTVDGVVYEVRYAGKFPGEMEVKFHSSNYEMSIDTSIDFGLFFARAMGKSETPVASAAAVSRLVLRARGPGTVPIGVYAEDFEVNTIYNLTLGPGDGESGNFQFINLETYLSPGDNGEFNPSNNASDFREFLNKGYTGTTFFEVYGSVDTLPGSRGLSAGNIIEQRIREGRIFITVPLIESYVNANGVTRLQIVGFAEFKLISYDKNTGEITGQFVRKIEDGPSVPGYSEYAIGTLKLVR